MTHVLTSTRPTARLVTRADEPEHLQPVQLVDTKTALSRALAEYIAKLQVTQPEGRTAAFIKVFDVWAEPEDVASFPSAVIFPVSDLTYEETDMATRTFEIVPGVKARRWASAKTTFNLIVWTNDPEERLMLCWMLENALNPVDGHAGFILEVPYYFNARARYLVTGLTYEDDSESAQQRWRKASFAIEAEIPAYATVGRVPYLIPTIDVKVI